jgi:hypothetical protein
MQRLGYFKHLVRRVTSTNTASIENLGNDLINVVTRKVSVPLTDELANYIRIRLSDRVYDKQKKIVDEWQKNGSPIPGTDLLVEIQDLFLSDRSIPSGVGKLVKDDNNIYPPFGINLGLLRAGTNSTTTRAISFLHLVSEQELKAFIEYIPGVNPLLLTQQQSLLLLYSLLDNDGEIVTPLWWFLSKSEPFNDRNAGDLLPSIYRSVIARHRKRALSVDMRERLAVLEKSAGSIALQADKIRYAGGTAREHASRPRLEPYVDIGIFDKPDRLKYEYTFSNAGRVWAERFGGEKSSEDIEILLQTRYFATAANALGRTPELLPDDEIPTYLRDAWKTISSPNGYAPIEEIALLAGINSLFNNNKIFEIASARDALIAFQKNNPYQVRFTVDRLGNLAHAKFIDESGAS